MNAGLGNIVKIECHETLPSTVELARSYARLGYPDKYIIFAKNQTKYNSVGEELKNGDSEKGVYLSCILRTSIFPSQASYLGSLAAVAMLNALEEHTTKELGIGWVSDIFCEGRKIASAAAEGKLDSFSSYEYIIVSFAAKLTAEDFPQRLTDIIRKVFESENSSISMIIAKDIISRFLELFPTSLKTPEKFMESYKQKFILGGKRISYISHTGKRRKCRVIAVDNNGALVVETPSGKTKTISNPRSVIIPKKVKMKRVSQS
jgi:BirA family biotin operon repressor/biotin-[acetyl-CoA-carboxylase] ligase